ncbi:unnamed protein product, partial [Polarella glacialis]
DSELRRQALDVLSNDKVSRCMNFDLEGCDLLTSTALSELAMKLPPQLEHLRLDCDRCPQLDDDCLEGLGHGLARLSEEGKLKGLELSFTGCALLGRSEHSLMCLAEGLAKLGHLVDCQLSVNDTPLGNLGLFALGRALRGLTQLLTLKLGFAS